MCIKIFFLRHGSFVLKLSEIKKKTTTINWVYDDFTLKKINAISMLSG